MIKVWVFLLGKNVLSDKPLLETESIDEAEAFAKAQSMGRSPFVVTAYREDRGSSAVLFRYHDGERLPDGKKFNDWYPVYHRVTET